MAAISAGGRSSAPYIIVKCSTNKANQSNVRVLDSLLAELDVQQPARWELRTWEKTLTLSVKGVPKEVITSTCWPNLSLLQLIIQVTFTRKFLIDEKTGTIVACQVRAWMDIAGLVMWLDLVLVPLIEKLSEDGAGGNTKCIVTWDNCSSQRSAIVRYALSES